MANKLRPENRKPIAAPGRIACAMASPTRLMRRSIRNTPMAPAPTRIATFSPAFSTSAAVRSDASAGTGTVSAKLRTMTAQLNTLAGYLDGVEALLGAAATETTLAALNTKNKRAA